MFFFFKQKTAYEMRISDWSSDVCSSDLQDVEDRPGRDAFGLELRQPGGAAVDPEAGIQLRLQRLQVGHAVAVGSESRVGEQIRRTDHRAHLPPEARGVGGDGET